MVNPTYSRRRQLEEEAEDEARAASRLPALLGLADVCEECGEVELAHDEVGRCHPRMTTRFRKREVVREGAAA